jgi:hypothetical protein
MEFSITAFSVLLVQEREFFVLLGGPDAFVPKLPWIGEPRQKNVHR